jgi:hypothetical protein
MKSKAFFVNGGYGRVLCSIPAFEKYLEENKDDDFIIVCEGGTDAFKGHPDLDERAYDHWHKNLFKEKIKDREIVTTEPYRIYEYYNQECSLAQAFDIQINNKGVRDLPPPTLRLNKDEVLVGRKLVREVKEKLKKDKVIVIQPFGRGVQVMENNFVDQSSRSIEYKDLKVLIKHCQKEGFGIVLMSELQFDFSGDNFPDEIAMPEGVGLRQWSAIIKEADHFLGCDSVGQHMAYIGKTPSTVVIGSTFPENVSYPDCEFMNIVDLGMHDRVYDPIRIQPDEYVNRKNEGIMVMTKPIHEYIMNNICGRPNEED